MLEFVTLTLGPVATNTYIVADRESHKAVVIDPAWNGAAILSHAQRKDWDIQQVWITHAHFDHIGGASELVSGLGDSIQVALHLDDRPLWEMQGGAALFGYSLSTNPAITMDLIDGMKMNIDGTQFEVVHTPGHTPGHCIFYCPDEGICFCGDLIFHDSVGRTDLPGGDWKTLVTSIHDRVFTLPDQTCLFPGHGPETTVAREKQHNPFVGLSVK